MSHVLRTATADDWAAYRDVRLRALAGDPDAYGSTLAREEAFGEADWRSRAGGGSPLLLALGEDAVLGTGGAYVAPGADEVVLWGFWTDPAHRGRGIGGEVLDRLLDWTCRRGLPVVLHVTQGNAAARRLYASRGFVPTGESEPLRDGSPLLVDVLRLPRD